MSDYLKPPGRWRRLVERMLKEPVALIALVASITALVLQARSMMLHVEPSLSCFLTREETGNGYSFAVLNDGPIAVGNLVVDHFEVLFDKATSRAVSGNAERKSSDLTDFGRRWIFADRLDRGAERHRAAGSIRWSEPSILILVFELAYLRDTDGRVFRKDCTFFVDDERVYSRDQLGENVDLFRIVTEETQRFRDEGWFDLHLTPRQ